MPDRVLLICGSLNQTKMMHQIGQHIPGAECCYTPFYADGLLGDMQRMGLLDFSILGGRHLRNTEDYLAANHLPVDFGGRRFHYDLVLTGTDLLVQRNVLGKRLVLIQEGMMDPETLGFHLVRFLGLPRFIANTAATGLSDAYDLFCVASEGYRRLFARRGVDPGKMVVTGIPNFDDFKSIMGDTFPYSGYVLVATSNARETFKWDNRRRFLHQVIEIAAGRPLVFKLHPNEDIERASREIDEIAPGAIIIKEGDIGPMVVNCDVLITQYSSVVFTGMALGKEVYSFFDLDELNGLLPVQNGGSSAKHIAGLCRALLEVPVDLLRVRQARLETNSSVYLRNRPYRQ